jgi:hypothetical protein
MPNEILVFNRPGGAGGGITNSAPTNTVPKSDGVDLVASRITDDGTTKFNLFVEGYVSA